MQGRDKSGRDPKLRELEGKLLVLMEQAYAFFKEAYPEGNNLSLFASGDGFMAMGFGADAHGDRVRLVDGYMSPHGEIRYSDRARGW